MSRTDEREQAVSRDLPVGSDLRHVTTLHPSAVVDQTDDAYLSTARRQRGRQGPPVRAMLAARTHTRWRRRHRSEEPARLPDTVFLPHRIEVTRPIPAPAAVIFDIVRSPAGHVAIDASGMLQDYTGEPAEKVGDTFVIHMDRESLNDFPLGRYDVTVHIITFDRDREIAWNLGEDIGIPHFYGYRLEPGEDGVTNVTSYYDWSLVNGDIKERFPIVPESALRASLGILERTTRRGL
jgi:hypothetical protein